jgi:hypothetical protein
VNHAIRRLPWPGEAAVVVSVVHLIKGACTLPTLDGRPVIRISAYLMEGNLDRNPSRLASNAGKAFNGTKIYGQGFCFANNDDSATPLIEMSRLIGEDISYQSIIKPYMGGEDLNNSPTLQPSRYVIDFGDRTLEQAADFPDLFSIVKTKVYSVRQKVKDTNDGRILKANWWKFFRPKIELYRSLMNMKFAMIIAETSPHMAFALAKVGPIFSHALKIFVIGDFGAFATMQSRVHEVWARFFSSSMKDDLRYTPSDCFETFPFCFDFEAEPALESIGQTYYNHRAALMIARNEGLTKTYNRFHDPAEQASDIRWLRDLHHDMDVAVLRTYGWDDLADTAAPEFLTEDTEQDHRYQGRLFWPAPFREEVLARLLALNVERAAEECRAGLTPLTLEHADDMDPDA